MLWTWFVVFEIVYLQTSIPFSPSLSNPFLPMYPFLLHTHNVRAYTCTHTHTHTQRRTWKHTHTHTHTHTQTRTHTLTQTHTEVRTHTLTLIENARACTHTRTHPRTHTCTHTHACTHTHTYACTCTHTLPHKHAFKLEIEAFILSLLAIILSSCYLLQPFSPSLIKALHSLVLLLRKKAWP